MLRKVVGRFGNAVELLEPRIGKMVDLFFALAPRVVDAGLSSSCYGVYFHLWCAVSWAGCWMLHNE